MESKANVEEIDFQKYLLVVQRRWLPTAGVFAAVVTLSSMYALSLKPAYNAQGSILIKTSNTSSLTGLGQTIGRLEALTTNTSPSDTQVKIVASNPLIQETITSLNLKDDKDKPLTIDAFIGKLKVEALKGTDVLQVSYSDNNPDLAAKVVNKLMDVYIRENRGANKEEAVTARKFIEAQIPEASRAVQRAESIFRRFKEKNKVIALQEEASEAVKTISKLEEQIAQTQAQLVDATAKSQKLQEQAKIDSQESVSVASLSQIPGIQQVVTQLQEAQSELEVERTKFQPGHPKIINLEEKVSALNSLLEGRVQQSVGNSGTVSKGNLQIGELRQNLIQEYARSEAQRVGLARQVSSLSSKWLSYKQRANVLPQLEQTQRELERQLKAAQTTYETLLAKRQEMLVAENQTVANARIISPALVPDKPTSNKKNLAIAGGGIVGIMLGVIAAFGLDLIDRSVKTVKEAREVFQYTLLGVIPSVSRKGKGSFFNNSERVIPKVVGRDIPQFPVGEAYQMLQANLKFLCSDKKLKAIVVTSSVTKEGKSEVAANLAVAMAQVGRRVLLVDADMRHPIQHHIWEMTNSCGLSNVIVDQVPIPLAVQEVMPNLYVLPSGVVPPNPVALLDSKRMASLMASFAEDYDCIIFDTPTLAGTADAAVLSKLSDGILLVARPGVLDWNSANATKEFLTQSGQNVLGMVINGVNIKNEPDSYFYYTRSSVESASPSRTFVGEKLVSDRKPMS
jgi:polysaccharide biosynthesis transport protein